VMGYLPWLEATQKKLQEFLPMVPVWVSAGSPMVSATRLAN